MSELPIRTDRALSRSYDKHDVAVPRAASIQPDGDVDRSGTTVFVGHPWGRRTTMLLLHDEKETLVTRRHTSRTRRPWWFEPGVRTFKYSIRVGGHASGPLLAYKLTSRDEMGKYGDAEDRTTIAKHRPAFLEACIGGDPHEARSMNDLFKVFYDVIELHRKLLNERTILRMHRCETDDFNICTSFSLEELEGKNTISESVSGPIMEAFNVGGRTLAGSGAVGMLTDLERIPLVSGKSGSGMIKEVAHGTMATPVYIARGVCFGGILTRDYILRDVRMPNLQGDVLRLYVQTYGEEHYNEYNENTDQSIHGGTPPTGWPDPEQCPTFTHRAEHDIESLFWSMFTIILRVRPITSTPETSAPDAVAEIWKLLRQHAIREDPTELTDQRSAVFGMPISYRKLLFMPEMHDVAQ